MSIMRNMRTPGNDMRNELNYRRVGQLGDVEWSRKIDSDIKSRFNDTEINRM